MRSRVSRLSLASSGRAVPHDSKAHRFAEHAGPKRSSGRPKRGLVHRCGRSVRHREGRFGKWLALGKGAHLAAGVMPSFWPILTWESTAGWMVADDAFARGGCLARLRVSGQTGPRGHRPPSTTCWSLRESGPCGGGFLPLPHLAMLPRFVHKVDQLRDDFVSSAGDANGMAKIEVLDTFRWPPGSWTTGSVGTNCGVGWSATECLHADLWLGM